MAAALIQVRSGEYELVSGTAAEAVTAPPTAILQNTILLLIMHLLMGALGLRPPGCQVRVLPDPSVDARLLRHLVIFFDVLFEILGVGFGRVACRGPVFKRGEVSLYKPLGRIESPHLLAKPVYIHARFIGCLLIRITDASCRGGVSRVFPWGRPTRGAARS